jgi:transposase
MLSTIKKSIKQIEEVIREVEERIDEEVSRYEVEIELLQTIPGVGRDSAIGIVAEIGVEMEQFPSELHLASWAGMSPGNNETGGKKKVDERRTETNI